MGDAKVEFTNITSLNAEALGEPGQRTFRILVDGGGGSAVIWMEKEQLFQMALAMKQLLAAVPEVQTPSTAHFEQREAPPSTHLEFKLGKLVLGQEATSGRIIIDAHDEESSEGDTPTVRVWGERSQVNTFAEEAIRVCAAGRPLCPLCGGPIDKTGHSCPMSNGHHPLTLTDLEAV